MSWSFQANGLPAEVLKKVRAELCAWECSEPEQSLRLYASHQIETAMRSWPVYEEVFVSASGSQYKKGLNEDGNDAFVNSLSVNISSVQMVSTSGAALSDLITRSNEAAVLKGKLAEAEDLIKALQTPPPVDSKPVEAQDDKSE